MMELDSRCYVSVTLKFLANSFCHDYIHFVGLQMMMMLIIDLQI